MLKLEETYDECEFIACKVYRRGREVVAAGLPYVSVERSPGVYGWQRLQAKGQNLQVIEKSYSIVGFEPGKISPKGWISPIKIGD